MVGQPFNNNLPLDELRDIKTFRVTLVEKNYEDSKSLRTLSMPRAGILRSIFNSTSFGSLTQDAVIEDDEVVTILVAS